MPALDYCVAVLSSLDGNAALLDSDGTIVAVNDAWSSFGDENGASPSSIGVGANYLDECRRAAAHSDTAKDVLDGLLAVLGGTSPIFHRDYRCDAPEVMRWFRLTVSPWHLPGARILVLHRDVSEEKLSAEIQSRTLQSVRAIIWSADVPLFRTTFLTGQIEEILGFSSQEWLDDPDLWKKQLHPEDRDWVLTYSSEAVQEGRNHQFDYRMVAADGRTIWLRQVVNVVVKDGQPIQLAGISFDISELKQAQKRLQMLSRHVLKLQDKERLHIARELHDDIGQRLAFLSMELARMEITQGQSIAALRGAIAEAKTQISEIIRDVSALSHGLHSRLLDSRGLVAASDELCRQLAARQNVTVNFQSEDVPAQMPDRLGLGIFRILQEALQNAVKHSGGKTFEVTLSGSSHFIELSVKDDGRGFDVEKAMKGKGLGLTSMEERVNLLRGEFSVDTRPSWGTEIRARVPFRSRATAAARGRSKSRMRSEAVGNSD